MEVENMLVSIGENLKLNALVKKLKDLKLVKKPLQDESTTNVRVLLDAIIDELPETGVSLSVSASIVHPAELESAIVEV